MAVTFDISNFSEVRTGSPALSLANNILLAGYHSLSVSLRLTFSGHTSADDMFIINIHLQKYVNGSWATWPIMGVQYTPPLTPSSDVKNYAPVLSAANVNSFYSSGAQHRVHYEVGYSDGVNPTVWKTQDNPVEIYPYAAPQITGFTALRCTQAGVTDEGGSYVKVSMGFVLSAIANHNTKALVVKWREFGDATWPNSNTLNIAAQGYTGSVADVVLSDILGATKNFDVKAEMTDLVTTTAAQKVVSPAKALLHLSADKLHVAIGKFCEAGGPGFDIDKDVRFRQVAVFDEPITMPKTRFPLMETECLTAANFAPFGTATPGGGGVAAAPGDANHPGVVVLRSGGNNPSGYSIYALEDSLLLAGGETFHAIFNPQYSTGNLVMRLGFCDALASAAGTVVDGVYMAIASGGVLTGKVTVNGATATVTSPYTMQIDTWYHAVVEVKFIESVLTAVFTLMDAAGSLIWSDSIATGIPTTAGRNVGAGLIAMRTSTSTNDLVRVDYLSVEIDRDLVR